MGLTSTSKAPQKPAGMIKLNSLDECRALLAFSELILPDFTSGHNRWRGRNDTSCSSNFVRESHSAGCPQKVSSGSRETRNKKGKKLDVDIDLHATLALFFMRQRMQASECCTRNSRELQGPSSNCGDWTTPREGRVGRHRVNSLCRRYRLSLRRPDGCSPGKL